MRKAALALALAGIMTATSAASALAGWFGPTVDPELVAQVPQDKRGAMDKADFELAVALQELDLARLKEELADRQQDLAELSTKLAKARQRQAELALDLARIEAVDAQGLGKKADNAKILGEVRADLTKNEAARIQLKAKVDQTELFIRDLTQRVAVKDKQVQEFKARRSGGMVSPASPPSPAIAPAKAAPAPAPQPAPPVPVTDKSPITEVVKETAGPAAPPLAPAPPEGDLKN